MPLSFVYLSVAHIYISSQVCKSVCSSLFWPQRSQIDNSTTLIIEPAIGQGTGAWPGAFGSPGAGSGAAPETRVVKVIMTLWIVLGIDLYQGPEKGARLLTAYHISCGYNV